MIRSVSGSLENTFMRYIIIFLCHIGISGTTWPKKGHVLKCVGQFYGTYERGLVTIDIAMACDLSFYSFFPN